MLVLTLLVLEGMARLAYYAAYGQGYGGGVVDGSDNLTPPPPTQLLTRPGTTRYGIPFTAMPTHRRNTPSMPRGLASGRRTW